MGQVISRQDNFVPKNCTFVNKGQKEDNKNCEIMKDCRFCHSGSVELLYPASNKKSAISASEFTCTNCGFGIHGPIVICGKCGIVYVDEKNDQKEISAYYEIAEDPLYFLEQPARQKTFKRYLRQLKKTHPGRGKLLDVGTNTGLFVKVALDDGWYAQGVEPNRWAVEYARKNYDIKIINKPFEEKTFDRESFDVITMWDVIEHFTDPVAEMKKVFNLLKPGGIFAFSTVDPQSQLAHFMGGKWSWYMEMHKVFFNRATAKHYLEKTGFKKIIFKRHFRYLSLGYLATRVAAISPNLSKFLTLIINNLSISKVIVPYYANDLYDCYAFR